MLKGADSLCGRLTEKINSNHNHKLVLAHMPLLMVCLEVCSLQKLKYVYFYVICIKQIKKLFSFINFRD